MHAHAHAPVQLPASPPGLLAPVRRWLARDPHRADAVFGVVVAVLGVLTELSVPVVPGMRESSPWSLSANLVAGLGVALRRRSPSLAMTLAGVTAGAYGVLHLPGPIPALAVLVTLYSEAAYGTRRASTTSLVGSMVVVTGVIISYWPDVTWVDVVSNYSLFTIPWFLGDNLRNRRALEVELVERARRAEQDRADLAAGAVAAERSRIARELHDVVAHAMGVMVIQAGAARRVLRTGPDEAQEALGAIEATGRSALGEMRRLVGVLRETAGLADRAPQPTLAGLPELVAAVDDPDLAVTLVVDGGVRPLSPGIDLAAYRIVQEALTNARRHAGPCAVAVTVTYAADELDVRVRDDGRGAAADLPDPDLPRHGLVGMRERTALYGGSVRAGPRPGGGYEVRARLPLAER